MEAKGAFQHSETEVSQGKMKIVTADFFILFTLLETIF